MALPPKTLLDPGQIIKGAYDEAQRKIRVDASISAPDGTSILIDATTDSIKVGNSATGPFLNVNNDGSINVGQIQGTISGDFSSSGLKNQGRITTMDIADVASPIPIAALTDRNAISIVNTSNSDILYLGFTSSVTPDNEIGTTSGWEINPRESFNLDIKNNIVLYAIAPSGITIRVKVMELS